MTNAVAGSAACVAALHSAAPNSARGAARLRRGLGCWIIMAVALLSRGAPTRGARRQYEVPHGEDKRKELAPCMKLSHAAWYCATAQRVSSLTAGRSVSLGRLTK